MLITDEEFSQICKTRIANIRLYICRAEFSHITRNRLTKQWENVSQTDIEKLKRLIHKNHYTAVFKGTNNEQYWWY